MRHQGRKLGILVSTAPGHANFDRALRLADAGLNAGADVYLYCIDEAVAGLANRELQSLRDRGLKLFACAHAAHRRDIPVDDRAVFGGLSIVGELIAATDRFVAFN